MGMDRRQRGQQRHPRERAGFHHDRLRGMDDEESFHYRYQHLEEVVGQLMSVAKDQNGCRCVLLSTHLERRSAEI